MSGTYTAIIALAVGLAATPVAAQQSASLPPTAMPVVASGDARAPYAWLEFCKRYRAECAVNTAEPERVEMTPKLWKTILSINLRVNKEIDPVTDMDHWGIVDRWDMAEDGRGDCEEYVHVKRKRLAEAGIPRRAMLNTVVIDDENAGHAVLMIRTDRGDFVLDNKRNAILTWQQTGYVFVKREAQDRVGWTSLGGVAGPTVTASR